MSRSSIYKRWGVALLLVAVAGYGFSASHRQLESGNDFPIYLDAARALYTGEPVYDVESGLHGYVYPPFLALVLRPLASLPLRVAVWLWYAVNIALTVALFRLTRTFVTRAGFGRLANAAAWTSLLVHSRFFLNNYDMGQVNILLSALILWAGQLSLDRKNSWLAGAPIGLAAAIKPHALIVTIPLIAHGRWKAAVGAAVTGVLAFGVLPAALLGPERTTHLLSQWNEKVIVPTAAGSLQGSKTYDQSPAAALRRLVVDTPAFGNARVSVADLSQSQYTGLLRVMQAVLGVFFLAVWFRRGRDPGAFCADIALALVAMLVLFGYGLRAHFVQLLLPGALVFAWARSGVPARLWVGPPAVVAAALIFVTSPGLIGRTASNWALALSAVTIGTLIQGTIIAVVRLRDTARAEAQRPADSTHSR